jgi:hypothetical protein
VAIEGLSIRPYLDHHFHEWIGLALRRAGFDVVIAKEVGNERLSDEQHLEWATEHRRTVLTHDRVDFTRLNLSWALQGRPHGGIIISLAAPQIPYREVITRLLRFLDAVTADEVANNLFWLNETWATPRQ